MSKQQQIEITLKAFKDMGARRKDLIKERKRLESDHQYLEEWYVTVAGGHALLRQESQAKSTG